MKAWIYSPSRLGNPVATPRVLLYRMAAPFSFGDMRGQIILLALEFKQKNVFWQWTVPARMKCSESYTI